MMWRKIGKAFWMVIEKVLRLVILPGLRAWLLRMFGASIGRNVRIYEVQLFNLDRGFRNLKLGDNVHVGTGCRIDLCGRVIVGQGTTISPGVTIITHSDPGSFHGSILCREFPPHEKDVILGEECWIGCNSTVMPGVTVQDRAVVGACSLVTRDVKENSVYFGVPAKFIRLLGSGIGCQ